MFRRNTAASTMPRSMTRASSAQILSSNNSFTKAKPLPPMNGYAQSMKPMSPINGYAKPAKPIGQYKISTMSNPLKAPNTMRFKTNRMTQFKTNTLPGRGMK